MQTVRMAIFSLATFAAMAILGGCKSGKGAFLENIPSQNDFATTIAKFEAAVKKEGLGIMQTIDHKANADKVGMSLHPNTVVYFGNPKLGTILMQCNPTIGLDLPLRMQFRADYEGKVTVTYINPEYWTLKHNIKEKRCLALIAKIKNAMHDFAVAATSADTDSSQNTKGERQ